MFRSCSSTDKLREVIRAVEDDAIKGYPIPDSEGRIVGYRRSAAAQKMYLAYMLGAPPKMCPPMRIDEQQLETVDGCRAAYMDIMRELAAGNLDHDSAAALRATVEGAVRTHQVQASQEHELMLASAGSESIILDAADPDIAGQIQRAVDAINAPSEDDDD